MNWKISLAIVCLGILGCIPSSLLEEEHKVPDDLSAGGTLKWSYTIPHDDYGYYYSVFSGQDEAIYVWTGDTIYAVNADGTESWTFGPYKYIGVPYIGSDGIIYQTIMVQDSEDYSYAIKLCQLNPDGTQNYSQLQWALSNPDQITNSVYIDSAKIFVFSNQYEDQFRAFNLDGTEKWIADKPNPSSNYFVGLDGNFYILYELWDESIETLSGYWGITEKMRQLSSSDGSTSFDIEIPLDDYYHYYYPIPVIGPDGTIYFNYEDSLYACNSDGSVKWNFDGTDEEEFAYLTIGDDGTLYSVFDYIIDDSFSWSLYYIFSDIYPDYSRLYVLNTDGELQLSVSMGNGASVPVIGPDGTIYFLSDDGEILYAMNSDGSWKWQYEPTDWIGDITIGENGTIYLTTWYGTIEAIND